MIDLSVKRHPPVACCHHCRCFHPHPVYLRGSCSPSVWTMKFGNLCSGGACCAPCLHAASEYLSSRDRQPSGPGPTSTTYHCIPLYVSNQDWQLLFPVMFSALLHNNSIEFIVDQIWASAPEEVFTHEIVFQDASIGLLIAINLDSSSTFDYDHTLFLTICYTA